MDPLYTRRGTIINGDFVQYNLRTPYFVSTYEENQSFNSLINFLEKLKILNPYILKDF